MATSLYKGLILGLPGSAALSSATPMRTTRCIALASNINHLADERSRVVCSMFSDGTGTADGLALYYTTTRGLDTKMFEFTYQARVGADGKPYPLRVRIGGWSVGAATSYFKVKMSGCSTIGTTASFTDANDVWRGFVSGSMMFTFDGASTPLAVPTFDAVGSASPVSIRTTPVTVTVLGYSAAVSQCVLSKLYAAEYVGL